MNKLLLLLLIMMNINCYAAIGNIAGASVIISGTSIAETIPRTGYIKGFHITYKDANEIYYSDGEIEVNGTLVKNTAASTAFELTTTNASDFYYIYIASTGVVTYSTTEPSWSIALHGWYNSTIRCIGVIWTSGVNTIKPFIATTYQGGACYEYVGVIYALVSGANPTGAFITLTATSDYLPVNVSEVKLNIREADAGAALDIIVDTLEGSNGQLEVEGWNIGRLYGWIILGASRDIVWYGANDDDDGGSYVSVIGYKITL